MRLLVSLEMIRKDLELRELKHLSTGRKRNQLGYHEYQREKVVQSKLNPLLKDKGDVVL